MSVLLDHTLAGAIIESFRAASIKDRASFWQLFGTRAFPALTEPVAEAVRIAAAVELVASRMDGGLAYLDENSGLAEAGLARLCALEVRQGLFDRARRLKPTKLDEEHAFARLLTALALRDLNGARDILKAIDRSVLSHPMADVIMAYSHLEEGHDDEARDRLMDGVHKLQLEAFGSANADFWKAVALVGERDASFLALVGELFVYAGFDIDTAATIVFGLADLSRELGSATASSIKNLRVSLVTLLSRKDARDFLAVQKWLRGLDLITECLELEWRREQALLADKKRVLPRKKSSATKRSLHEEVWTAVEPQRVKDDDLISKTKIVADEREEDLTLEPDEELERRRLDDEAMQRLARSQVQLARLQFAVGHEMRGAAKIRDAYQSLNEKRDIRVLQLARPIDIPSIPSVRKFEVGASQPVGLSPISRVDADPLRPTSGLGTHWVAEIDGASVLTGDRSGSVFWYVSTRDGWMLADGLNVHPRLHFGSDRERMSSLSPASRVLIDGPATAAGSSRLLGRSVLLGGVPNYYHWLMEYLPKIGVLKSLMPGVADAPVSWIVNDNLAPWQTESLTTLGVQSDLLRTVKAGVIARCDSLVVPSMMSASDATGFLRRQFGAERDIADSRKIYVSRLDADVSRRRIYQEELLVAALHQAGFEIIVPSEMSLQDQVDAFADASVIVGPHGAGMTNLVFAHKQSVVVEIVNSHNKNYRFFSDIADAVGLRYARFLGSSERANSHEPENANSIVDPEKLLAFIDRLRGG